MTGKRHNADVSDPRLVGRIEALEARVLKLEGGGGYTCVWCGQPRLRNWFVYEIEKDGQWLRPCCAVCAREHKSRGPFPPMLVRAG